MTVVVGYTLHAYFLHRHPTRLTRSHVYHPLLYTSLLQSVLGNMTDAMDIDPPAPAAPPNAMAALMAASKEKGKGRAELSQAEVDAKDKKDKEGLPWYVLLFVALTICWFKS
jgi:hypothetical protein